MTLLAAEHVTKRFGGITALDNVSIDVDHGEVVALIGPNGAGKTTLFNCLLGLSRPDRGTVTFDERDLTRVPTHRRARQGISRTFQRIELFAGMTPREHLLLADRIRRGNGALWKDMIGRGRPTAAEHERADGILALLALDAVADRSVDALSLGIGRLVEIGRALVTEPKLLLLDEPSSGLDRHETDVLAATLRDVTSKQEIAVLLVEHDVEFVRYLATRAFVLDFGTLISSGATDVVFADEAVRRAYLGNLV